MTFLSPTEFPKKVEGWCRELVVDTRSSPKLEAPVLLVLDMQREFLTPAGQLPVWGGPAIVPNVTRLISAFREAKRLVIFSRHICLEPHKHKNLLGIMERVTETASILREGSDGAAFQEDIVPTNGDLVITKYHYSGFFDTPLDTFLRTNGAQEVVITGVATNICCETTAHDAFFRGYKVLFTVDATGGTDERAHLASLRNIRLSYGKLVTAEQLLHAAQKA